MTISFMTSPYIYRLGLVVPMVRVTRPRLQQRLQHTFRLDTRSAVSRRVNWLIWSTMVAILGLVAAASVELCRLAMLCWKRDPEARTVVLARSWRAQHCAAYLQESDMVSV
jgi:hypothetical protein